jgi:hypothetical protein
MFERRVALAAACLITTLASPASAQDEAAELRRVELPELGLAVSLPADWDVVVPMLDSMDEIEAELRELLPDDVVRQLRTVVALNATNGLAYPEPGVGGCVVGASVALEPTDEVFGLEHVYATDHLMFWNDPGFDGEQTMAEVGLPIGISSHVELVEHDEDGDWVAHFYRFVLPDGFGWIECLSFEEGPDDGWLPIAQTLELLPAGPVPAPAYEVEFPEAWVVDQPDLSRTTSMLLPFSPSMKPLVRPELVADAPGDTGSCSVFDWSLGVNRLVGYQDLAEALRDDIVASQDNDELVVLDSALVDLEHGRAARVDMRLRDELDISRWHFKDGAAWFYLQCAAREAPPDRWRSIAETFRFER